MERRSFIKTTSLAGTTLGLTGIPSLAFSKPSSPVRIGLLGVGLRGRGHLSLLLQRKDVEVAALCDIDPDAIQKSKAMISKEGKKTPKIYQSGEWDWKNLLEKEDLEGVIISTPWRWHVPMAVGAMHAGMYAGVEVPSATTLAECWDLVHAQEASAKPCMILENVCYRRDVMAILQMVRKGMFGELLHMQCGYQHDLRHVKFNDGKTPYGGGVEFGEKGISEARWRTQHSVDRNGDLYPTHGIGPVAKMLGIETGNRFVSLTSMATKARSLHNHIVDKGGADHPNAGVNFKLGDVVTTMIKTARDETILVQHDTNAPRPYSLGFRVQGTKGIWMDLNKSLYLEGISKEEHRWENAEAYLDQYDHPLWKKYGSDAEGAGHGGMDFFVVHAFIESIKAGAMTPLNAYDAASWCAITPLSEHSIALGGQPVYFPDFSRGKWMHRKDAFAMDDRY